MANIASLSLSTNTMKEKSDMKWLRKISMLVWIESSSVVSQKNHLRSLSRSSLFISSIISLSPLSHQMNDIVSGLNYEIHEFFRTEIVLNAIRHYKQYTIKIEQKKCSANHVFRKKYSLKYYMPSLPPNEKIIETKKCRLS